MPDNIPGADDSLSRWLTQFLAAATTNATALGLSPADLTALGNAITVFKTGLDNCTAAVDAAKAATKTKNNARAIVEALVRKLMKRFTTEAGYTPAIGEALGMLPGEGSGSGVEPAPMKPTGTAKALEDYHAEVRAHMKGADAVDFYCQREGDAEPVLLGRFTHARYVDTRGPLVAGKPEKRNYFIQLVKGDHHWGPMSDPIGVVCSG